MIGWFYSLSLEQQVGVFYATYLAAALVCLAIGALISLRLSRRKR